MSEANRICRRKTANDAVRFAHHILQRCILAFGEETARRDAYPAKTPRRVSETLLRIYEAGFLPSPGRGRARPALRVAH